MPYSLHTALYNWNHHVLAVFWSEREKRGGNKSSIQQSEYTSWYWVVAKHKNEVIWQEKPLEGYCSTENGRLTHQCFQKSCEKNCETRACLCCSSKMTVKEFTASNMDFSCDVSWQYQDAALADSSCRTKTKSDLLVLPDLTSPTCQTDTLTRACLMYGA